MLIIISPAKTLDFETPATTNKHTLPIMLDDSVELIDQLRKLEPDALSKLMSISPKLAVLNSNRYYEWALPFNTANAKQSALAFKGDVYTGLNADTFNPSEMDFAQKHLRILSGLYGVLRPLDLIQAYRLEMGAKFKNQRGNNLYEFWGDAITDLINQDIKKQKSQVLLNLASIEYFKSINARKLNARVINPIFKDKKNGAYKIISFYAKKARGLMSRYIIQNKLTEVENIKGFNLEGYTFKGSTNDDWLFTRDDPEAHSSKSH
ncbi:MAG: peroxide stress protein YaaA [Nitrosomonas sp.]|nr:peroxide stress protein YaaA [Nitrosomonas sp.]MDP1949861.1 peroxide stress protein YaaA [Nitrosomonas sp.]